MYKVTLFIKNMFFVLAISMPLLNKTSLTTVQDFIVEFSLFFIASMMGVGVKVASLYRERQKISLIDFLALSFLGLTVGGILTYLMLFYESTLPRFVVVFIGSFLAEIVLKYLKERFPTFFDAYITKQTGVPMDDSPKDENP